MAPNPQNTLFFSLFAENFSGGRANQHSRPSQPFLKAENFAALEQKSPLLAGLCILSCTDSVDTRLS
jgi:hypothetical protein